MKARIALAACLLLLIWFAHEGPAGAEDIARLQSGVVKITAKPPSGTTNIGTGFIVRLETNTAYIVTAAHVVAGDTHPRVEFFTKRNTLVTAEVLGLEGDDDVRGLALLVVKGADTLPQGLTVLSLSGATRLTGGEDILVIGFSRNAGPWALIKGNISSRQGRDVFFSPSIESGHSGGPIFQGGKVVGIVGSGSQSIGRGITVGSVQDYIEGFGITAQEATASPSSVASVPSSPAPASSAKPESRQPTKDHGLTGKDGAPMVLVPAGEFMMGSGKDDQLADGNERPLHQIYLDAYYLDQYEVTTSRYARFLQQQRKYNPPSAWSEQILKQHGQKPVIYVSWYDAYAYCAWAGKRLPTEAEWEKAARGTDQRLYPWGNEVPLPQRANFNQSSEASYTAYYEALTDVGSFEQGKSPYGLYDMTGNVWEWVTDWYESDYYAKSPDRNPKGPSSGKNRVLRGGGWSSKPHDLRSTIRLGHYPPSGSWQDTGFRCAQDAK